MEELKLTTKQETFCKLYVANGFNGRKAAIEAGYAEKNAVVIAAQNLRKLNVKQFIEKLTEKKTKDLEITAERIIQEYSRIAFFDIKKLFNEDDSLKKITELDDDTSAAIAGIDIASAYKKADEHEAITEILKKIKNVNKIAALDSLARIKGMFVDKIEHKVESVQINFDFTKLTQEERISLSNLIKKMKGLPEWQG